MRRAAGSTPSTIASTRVADVEDLRRMLDALAPRHLADVDQAFDARLELDERAVVGEADDLAAHARARPGSDPCTVAHGSCTSCLWPSETRSVAGS